MKVSAIKNNSNYKRNYRDIKSKEKINFSSNQNKLAQKILDSDTLRAIMEVDLLGLKLTPEAREKKIQEFVKDRQEFRRMVLSGADFYGGIPLLEELRLKEHPLYPLYRLMSITNNPIIK